MNALSLTRSLPTEARPRALTLLNRQLAHAIDLRLRAKQALWNIRRSELEAHQTLCAQVLHATRIAAEALAKRASDLGGVAEATVQGVGRNTRLSVHPAGLTRAPDHLWAFCGALVQYTASAREAVTAADLNGDYDTGDLFALISRAADTLLWEVGEYLSAIQDASTPVASNRVHSPVTHSAATGAENANPFDKPILTNHQPLDS